jgi:hypothetical protein
MAALPHPDPPVEDDTDDDDLEALEAEAAKAKKAKAPVDEAKAVRGLNAFSWFFFSPFLVFLNVIFFIMRTCVSPSFHRTLGPS